MALATADIHIKIDPSVKRKAEKNLKKLGITMSDLINLTLRGFNRERRLPYMGRAEMEVPEALRVETGEQLREMIREAIENDDGTRYTLDDVRKSLTEIRERYVE